MRTVANPPEPATRAAPTVVYGPGSLRQLPRILSDLEAARVLLVTGRRSFSDTGASDLLPALERGREVVRWSDFSPDVDSRELAQGVSLAAHHRPDTIVAIGGGSVLDMAKLLAGFTGRDPGMVERLIADGERPQLRTVRLVLVPTTSGSGAEATHFAVVYIGTEKHSVGGPAMRADAIVLDPTLTLTSSPYQRACSGIDAVAQAIESLWAVGATARSRGFARQALRHLVPSIQRFVRDPDDAAARAMMIGSHLAGRGIDVSRTTGAHALAYHLTKQYGVPHGHAVALTLGEFLEAHSAPDASLAADVDEVQHRAVMGHIGDALSPLGPGTIDERWRRLCRSIGLSTDLSAVGMGDTDRQAAFAASANAERLGNNPIVLDAEGMRRLVGRAVSRGSGSPEGSAEDDGSRPTADGAS